MRRLLFLDRPPVWRRIFHAGVCVAFWGLVCWYSVALLVQLVAAAF